MEGEGRIRKSLKTSDKSLALREAERLTIDARAAQMAGAKVLAASIAECLECLARYEEHQDDRLARGGMRRQSPAQERCVSKAIKGFIH